MQMPAAQLGAAQMGGPQAAGPGFGMGQQLMQGQMGASQMAQPQGFQMTPEMLQKLGPMAAQLMQQHQQQGQPQQMPPMMQGGMHGAGMQQNGTQASRGYLAQGGGIAPRNIINKGY
jgi:hypothetical protein